MYKDSLILDCLGTVPWVGDTFCDDENNNPECDYDGGDCCGGQLTYCSVCWCVITNMTYSLAPLISTTPYDCRDNTTTLPTSPGNLWSLLNDLVTKALKTNHTNPRTNL